METAAHHRRIELQSAEDFAFLVDNVRRAAADSVAAAFPPVVDEAVASGSRSKDGGNDDDDLHARVEALVGDYIRRAFALASPNLTINGLPVDPQAFWEGDGGKEGTKNPKDPKDTNEDVEPFDARRRQRVEELARDEEDLLRDIALLKRRVPAAAVRAREQALARALAEDAAAAAAADERAAAAMANDEAAEGKPLAVDIDDATRTAFAQAVGGLGRLKQAMPATVARMERARVAGTYAEAER